MIKIAFYAVSVIHFCAMIKLRGAPMSPNISLDQPAAYNIRVQGALDERWAAYFEELHVKIETAADGSQVTCLSGCLPDQAAVQGVLQKLYNLGFPLLMVEAIEQDCQ
jgi:hypothetical protein